MQLDLSKWLLKYFSLNGSVTVPGLGKLTLVRVPSTNDFANKLFYPPLYRYRFESNPADVDEEVLKYLKYNLQVSDEQLAQLIHVFKKEVGAYLTQTGEIHWEGLGLFQQINNEIVFTPSNTEVALLDQVKYEHVVRETYSHEVLTGDRIQQSEDLQAYFEEQKSNKSIEHWKIFSLVIVLLSVALLVFRFMQGDFHPIDSRYDRIIFKQESSSYNLIKSF